MQARSRRKGSPLQVLPYSESASAWLIPEFALGGGLEKGACTSLLANGEGAMAGLSALGLPPTFCTSHALLKQRP